MRLQRISRIKTWLNTACTRVQCTGEQRYKRDDRPARHSRKMLRSAGHYDVNLFREISYH